MTTQQVLIKTHEIVSLRAKAINEASNDMQGTPYWNSCKRFIKIWFKQNEITEISVNDFSKITGFKKEIAQKMLLEINADIFKKK